MATVPYLGQKSGNKKAVWVCPAAPLPLEESPGSGWVFSYSIHGRFSLAQADLDRGVPKFRSLNADRHSEVILVAEATQNQANHNLPDLNLWNPGWAVYGDVSANDLDQPLDESYADGAGNLSYHHGGFANAVMLDGSAKSIKRGDLKLRNIMARTK